MTLFKLSYVHYFLNNIICINIISEMVVIVDRLRATTGG